MVEIWRWALASRTATMDGAPPQSHQVRPSPRVSVALRAESQGVAQSCMVASRRVARRRHARKSPLSCKRKLKTRPGLRGRARARPQKLRVHVASGSDTGRREQRTTGGRQREDGSLVFQQGVNSLCRCECLQPGPAAVPSLHAAYPATSKRVNANVGHAAEK